MIKLQTAMQTSAVHGEHIVVVYGVVTVGLVGAAVGLETDVNEDGDVAACMENVAAKKVSSAAGCKDGLRMFAVDRCCCGCKSAVT